MSKDTTAPIDAAARPVVVIDTNVWLDLLVFDDPASRALRTALDAGRLDVVMSDRCEAEWQVIVAQPRWDARGVDRPALHRALAEATRRLPADLPLPRPVPVCRDRHDQKFVELALRAHAGWLISKDRDLLKLRRRMAQHGCTVVDPAAFPLA
ncbi:PIN domain-containing protein [soil metagenome]